MAIDIKSTTIHHRVSGGGQLVVTSVEQQFREWVKGVKKGDKQELVCSKLYYPLLPSALFGDLLRKHRESVFPLSPTATSGGSSDWRDVGGGGEQQKGLPSGGECGLCSQSAT